jgi:hypothetical protein
VCLRTDRYQASRHCRVRDRACRPSDTELNPAWHRAVLRPNALAKQTGDHRMHHQLTSSGELSGNDLATKAQDFLRETDRLEQRNVVRDVVVTAENAARCH